MDGKNNMQDATINQYDYSSVGQVCYSDPKCESYKKAAAFLGVHKPVEDWGGATGWAKKYFTSSYKNIDGSAHKNVDVIADLTEYTSNVNNILIRQVLESNINWEKIINNAKKSFTDKLCIVISTPLVQSTRMGMRNPIVDSRGKVDQSKYFQEMLFSKNDILNLFPKSEYKVEEETISTEQYYRKDWILYVEKIH